MYLKHQHFLQYVMMFELFNNKITIYLRTDISESIHHQIHIVVVNEVKQLQLIIHSLDVVME